VPTASNPMDGSLPVSRSEDRLNTLYTDLKADYTATRIRLLTQLAFLWRLTDPEELGHACTQEVRDEAMKLCRNA